MWFAWSLPPRVLSKMSFEEGIPQECRTLVVVPMMLLTPDSIRGEIEKLEVRYLSNSEANLHFSLLADFTDAEEPEMPEDDKLLGLAIKGIEELNARHGAGAFILFHRTRVWCQAVSDLYQDILGNAIYHGKAIYDVQAFHKILTGRFPEQRLLSHDLIEGVHVGVGLATDVELFEQFPYDYTSYSKRQHRWIRGDWQIASWVLPRVPDGQQQRRAPNLLSLIDRWKILDNLRRSLLAPASLLFLMCSWSFNAAPAAASALVSLVLLVPLFFQILQRLAQRWRGDVRALHEASSDLNRAIVIATFLPHQAYLSMDAIVRACYRPWFSRRHLLEWHTAEISQLTARSHVDAYRAQFYLISLMAGLFLFALAIRGFSWETAYHPFLLLWVSAPAVQHWMGWQRRSVRRLEEIAAEDQRYLRRVARETWRYFDDLVGPEHN